MILAGTPTTRLIGGTWVPSFTIALAPTMEYSPMTEPSRTVECIPIMHWSFTVAWWTMALWPMETFLPICVGPLAVTWMTQLSWTLEPSSMVILLMSPRMVAWSHTLQLGPISTSPIMTAVGAI